MGVFINITMDAKSRRVLDRHAEAHKRLIPELEAALEQGLGEVESHVKLNKLSGTYKPGERRDGKAPLAVRSGALRQAVTHAIDQVLSGFVGVAQGLASAYARMVLGDGTTVIRPKRAKFLWIPLPDNLNASGQTRLSPRAARSLRDADGNEALQYRKSRKGNLIAGTTAKTPGNRGKGFTALFVLLKQVEVKGTNALAEAVEEKSGRIAQLLQAGLNRAIEGGAG